ncbi:MAG: LysM peptidoglycan-binding domain-containing protein, partial [Nitrososphaerales archaeon]
MAANLGRLARVSVLLCLLVALIVAAQPAPARAEPSRDNIIYVVQPGDRVVDIAARYGVSASAIVRANGLANADQIYPGQQLIIPGSTALTSTATTAPATAAPSSSGPSPTAAGGQPTKYTVQLGDTLASIARSFGVSAAALAQANGITNPDLIWVGQQLTVPGPGASGGAARPQPTVTPVPVPLPSTSWTAPTAQPPPTAAPTAQPTTGPAEVAASGPKIHVVQPGETLSTIARKYGVSVGDLVAANGLGSPDVIGVGVRLLIPGQ